VSKKLLIIDAAAMGYDLLREAGRLTLGEMVLRPTASVLPAVTCTVQASFRTASPPQRHGMIANGRLFRELGRAMFWEQSASLVSGQRIWDRFRRSGRTVGMLFWQQSLGEDADVILSPAPIHKHHGGMIEDCYSKPGDLYAWLCGRLGRPFRLRDYWGPLASVKAGDWIANATAELLSDAQRRPDLCLTYLPSLDYDLQRCGPRHPKSRAALDRTLRQLDILIGTAERNGYELVVFGDYAIAPCTAVAWPNRALLAADLMKVRNVGGRLYADLHASRAFAVADHEIAHVYVPDAADIHAVRQTLAGMDGVGQVLDRDAQREAGLAHPNSGELVILAAEGHWLAYPWWTHRSQRPEYASHVDIHNKPGYDPCELFFGWPPPSTSQDAGRIRGSHGRIGSGRAVAWGSTLSLGEPGTLVELATAVQRWLDDH